RNRPAERGLELGERERQRGRGAREVELVQHRQEVQRETGIIGAPLHGVEDAADDDDPPAVEETSRTAISQAGLHARFAIASTSLITSTTAGEFDARALSSADRMSSGRSTRIPTQPIASATFAKFTSWLKCHISVARPRCWPPYAASKRCF